MSVNSEATPCLTSTSPGSHITHANLKSKAAASLSCLIKSRRVKDLLDSQGAGSRRGKHSHESSITVLSLRASCLTFRLITFS